MVQDKLKCFIIIGDSRHMDRVETDSVHLIITSPPYFNTKTYSEDFTGIDLGNINDYETWKYEIKKVWQECFRTLAPGRKLFINIMNLPLSTRKGFHTLNIVGHTIDMCEDIGFIFKREVIWHKTNGVRAHFGTFPYPGGILINNMHEQILEFDKPGGVNKYKHLSREQKEVSKLSKEFWLKLKNTDVWLMKPYKSGTREHLAPFPEELPYRIIKAFSYISETVLDPFAGMGTTGKAAISLGRNVILYEVNKDFLPLINKNIETGLFTEIDKKIIVEASKVETLKKKVYSTERGKYNWMMTVREAKTIYAQSSDIKSRTYLEYRKDMKKKAIAELEVLPWLENILRKEYGESKLEVEKFGGDRTLWFLRKGGVTREPDFMVKFPDGNEKFIEFQYADKSDLGFFDFKISKITPRASKEKERVKNIQILYIIKPTLQYTILSPGWIAKEGEKGFVSAWRSYAYWVPKNRFETNLKYEPSLKGICQGIDMKIAILDFQHNLINITKDKLSYLLQQVVDEEKILSIVPNTLNSFFKVCFILDNIERAPLNANLWIVYLLSFVNDRLTSFETFQLLYSLDFLYSKITLKENELKVVVDKISRLLEIVKSFRQTDGSYKSSKDISPINETRNCLFSINIIEDIIQDIQFYYETKDKRLNPIKKIYENIEDLKTTYSFISR